MKFRNTNFVRRFLAMQILAAVSAVASATPLYSYIDLGTLGGGFSSGSGLNSQGVAVGESHDHAFYWDGSMHDIGTLSGGSISTANAINSSGTVVGYSSRNGTSSPHAFLYDGTLHDIGTLGGVSSYAYAINDRGAVVGEAATGNGPHHAFLYDGVMHDLGTLPTAAGTPSTATGINNSNIVVGYSSSNTAGSLQIHAFLYDGIMHDLGTLGGPESEAYAINDNSVVVGGSRIAPRVADRHAFLYDGSMHDLGTLGGTNSEAYDVNNLGFVVGQSKNSNGEAEAFLYDGTGMFSLNSLLTSNPDDIDLFDAQEINDSGQIVATASIRGVSHAFLLTPTVPVPATAWLFGSSLAGLITMRRKTTRE